jgi:exopolyphosphatase / guanosine-5'-triphosphate,3'-diphosphate pyrophosphatase
VTTPRAAVDVGSNSVRLLIVGADGARVRREMAITRLAAGVDATGHLDDAALERTLRTIARFRDLWVDHGVDGRVRIAATSAVRDASDRQRFFDGVLAATGVPAEVLSGAEEAALAYAGATAAVEVARPTAVIDIGGGSTELIVGDRTGEVAGSVSLQLGCVRITERHLASDPPSADELAAAHALIEAQLDHAVTELSRSGVSLSDAASLVAVAGTATTLGALHLGLDRYDEDRIHGARMPAAALAAMADRLTLMTAAERAELGPIQPGREDVIHGGALVLHAALTRAGLDEVVISEADSLDGLAASLAGTWHGVAGPWEPAEPEDDNPPVPSAADV